MPNSIKSTIADAKRIAAKADANSAWIPGEEVRSAMAAITQKDRPKTEDILKALADVVALYEQGLIVHRSNLTQSGQRHAGETFAQARAILAKTRGWQP